MQNPCQTWSCGYANPGAGFYLPPGQVRAGLFTQAEGIDRRPGEHRDFLTGAESVHDGFLRDKGFSRIELHPVIGAPFSAAAEHGVGEDGDEFLIGFEVVDGAESGADASEVLGVLVGDVVVHIRWVLRFVL